ncbi:MAG: GNAT family N-acetyltransferase [Clostridia bacterium]|nr:GNAT family N-acetyltransferase [Clostridia bacterium]
MDCLRLVVPDASLTDEINAYRKAMLDAGSSMDGCGSLCRHEADVWLIVNDLMTREETCPEGWVPATQYAAVRVCDGHIVGMIQLRHRFNDFLREYGGHIGYSVHPDERRKGYAHWMLSQVLPLARARGMERVLVTCDADNEASRRTILSCGGVFDRTAYEPGEQVTLERYWIKT